MVDIIIIGGGAAGMTAALNALRNKKEVLLFESDSFGGQIALSPRVENIPSIKEISGADFSDNLFNQIIELGCNVELEEVTNITKDNNIFTIQTNYNTYQAKSVIIAAGVKHKPLGLKREEELIGKGISYCAICDGAFFEGMEVCVVGDANSALQYTLMLSNICPKIYLCTLFDRFFGDKTLIERVYEKTNVEIIHNIGLVEYLGKDKIEGLKFINQLNKEELIIKCDGVFIAIGQIPMNQRFANICALDKDGYIITNENCETSTPGLYAVGDCRAKSIRQLTTAISDGAIAAVMATIYLERNE